MCHASCKTVEVKKKAKEEKWHNFLPSSTALSQIPFRWPGQTLHTPIFAQQVLMRTQMAQKRTGGEKKCLWREQESMRCVHGASRPQLPKKCKVQLHRRNPEGLLVLGKSFKILGVTWGITAHCFLKMLHVKIKVIINCYSVHGRIYQGRQSSVAATCLLRNVTCAQVTSLGGFSCPLTTSTARHKDFPKAKVTQNSVLVV